MEQVKKTPEYTIFKKKSGRYAVKGKDKQWLHGDDKASILLAESLIKRSEPKAPDPAAAEPAEEAAGEAAAGTGEEAPAA